ncbi:hypothetical protein SERLA73DRAFT_182113 [Serpula lacrymans var. lacrymans S7.3]|uniref:Uncharacterized protein n=2 Tax=Serpula lacrymans var. lacrymans TaxID=341189 RepID=F8PZB2_SERL3|nr:uncharacterized protein SERLADRAFT_390601 [Serpula lacrymans var. lacrymans S7.9]EGN99225.1 hypothetical protein SERLA73DRAFT_182113 [Serpula lacrymans var. lacrymans S7.3]EGO24793.1 hypothetical protein SERLADRAFT_390601 [Serpula lacrymans var. lacrymans S7.9]
MNGGENADCDALEVLWRNSELEWHLIGRKKTWRRHAKMGCVEMGETLHIVSG